jgi:hypothetical protein
MREQVNVQPAPGVVCSECRGLPAGERWPRKHSGDDAWESYGDYWDLAIRPTVHTVRSGRRGPNHGGQRPWLLGRRGTAGRAADGRQSML